MSELRGQVLVVGATSAVGRAIVRELSQHHDVISTHHRNPGPNTVPFDLGEDDPSLLALDWPALRAVVVAGGVTKLNTCARAPEATARVNVDGTLRLIRYAQEAGVDPIFLSSDAVFAGDLPSPTPHPKAETDPVGPTTVYGRQKQEVERSLLSSGGTVLRLSKLVSTRAEDDGSLPDLAAQLVRGESVRAATDQFLNLTWVEDVARAVGFTLTESLEGLWHVAAAPVRSRHAWSIALARELGVDESLVQPCSLLDFDFPEPRPRDCSLDGSKLQRRLPWKLRPGDQLIADLAAGR